MVIKTHPIYDNYEFDSDTGYYRKVGSVEWLHGSCNKNYLDCSIRSKKDNKQKTIRLHRAIWETFNGNIPDNYEIDHLNNDTKSNILTNLQCITMPENRKRRNHDFLKEIQKTARTVKKKAIKSINLENNETHVFKTQSACSRYFGCSPALVYLICEKKNNSKTFMKKYTFEYTDEAINTIVPDKRIGVQRVSDQHKADSHKKAMKKYYEKKS